MSHGRRRWLQVVLVVAAPVVLASCAGPSKSRGTDAPSWRIVMPADSTRVASPRIIERLRDNRRDGRVEVLEIEAFVPVDSAGEYVLMQPELRDQSGRLIATGHESMRSSGAPDSAGTAREPIRFEADSLRIGRVRFSFDGGAIRQGGADGPWVVRFGAAAFRSWVRGSPEFADRTYEARTARHRAADFGRDDPALDGATPRKE